MTIAHKFVHAVGPGLVDCHWLGYRFHADGFKPDQSDSWIVHSRSGESLSMNVGGWVTDLARTGNTIWATESLGVIYRRPADDDSCGWEEHRVDSGLEGIWGLSDECVFAWGKGKAPTMFHNDGSGWREVPTPGHVVAVHGSGPDLIFAVGLKGLTARWDGSAFVSMESPVSSVLRDVFVASEEELYAVSTQGEVLRGTTHGWEVVLKHKNPLYCIAKWGDRVWVGAGDDGLFSLRGTSLEVEKANVKAERFHVAGTLLTATPKGIAEPGELPAWRANFVSRFERMSAQRPPHWHVEDDDWDDDDLLDDEED